jgi:hypothetical protein
MADLPFESSPRKWNFCAVSISHTEWSILTGFTDCKRLKFYKIFVKWLSVSRMLLFIGYSSLFSIKIEISCNMYLYSRLNTVFNRDIVWLFMVLRPAFKIFSLAWKRHHYQWRAAKFSLTLGAQGLWAGRDLYRATLAVTRDIDN